MNDANDTPPTATVIVDSEPRPVDARRPRLLLTNDDGIESVGLRRLAQRLAQKHDVLVVAPDDDRSGSGTGIGRFDPRKGVALGSADFEGVEAYTIAGPPGLAATAAMLGAFGRIPDLVVSGINLGMNTGHSVLHSGTVGGALTARTFGRHGVALSLARSDPWQWETAIAVAEDVIEWVLHDPNAPYVINVNVPARPLDEIEGVTWAKLDEFGYFRVASPSESGEYVEFEIVSADSGRDPETDTALCFAGWVTLTPLTTIEAELFPDVPAEHICRAASRR